jgi:hypothetical protein
MNLINRIFRRNMVDCPRCLGKGYVDLEDIKRLKKDLFWLPGKCAYCNGISKVPPDRLEKVNTELDYLTTDLHSLERHKLINGDTDALKRATVYVESLQNFIKKIEHLYYIENMEPNDISEHIFHKQERFLYSAFEKQELIDYIERIIKSKLK